LSEYERGFAAGYAAAHRTDVRDITVERGERLEPPVRTKRKASAYSKKYGKAFKKVQGKYKLKSGKWGKDGFKRAQKAAHALAKKMK
jgi:hypothetical protein